MEKVREEALAGRKSRSGYIEVDPGTFGCHIGVETVSDQMLVKAYDVSPGLVQLDNGEKQLLAYMYSLDPEDRPLLLTTADKAAIRITCELGFRDNLISLEELADFGALTSELKSQYSRGFLLSEKTKSLLGLCACGLFSDEFDHVYLINDNYISRSTTIKIPDSV